MGTNSMEDLVEGIKGTKNSLQVSLPSSDPVAEKQNRENWLSFITKRNTSKERAI